MKSLPTLLGAAAILSMSAFAAPAATLGTIEFERFTNSTSPFTTDLGGVSPTIGDATVTFNDFNGAASLPGGLPFKYDTHIDRTFIGDRNRNTADSINDNYLFKMDPATRSGGASADAALTLVAGANTGMQNVSFSLFETDDTGTPGALVNSSSGESRFSSQIGSGQSYLLQVMGNLRADIAATLGIDESTNVGRYDIVLALIPLPPAILLFLTGLGAFFGFVGLRKRAAAA